MQYAYVISIKKQGVLLAPLLFVIYFVVQVFQCVIIGCNSCHLRIAGETHLFPPHSPGYSQAQLIIHYRSQVRHILHHLVHGLYLSQISILWYSYNWFIIDYNIQYVCTFYSYYKVYLCCHANLQSINWLLFIWAIIVFWFCRAVYMFFC